MTEHFKRLDQQAKSLCSLDLWFMCNLEGKQQIQMFGLSKYEIKS